MVDTDGRVQRRKLAHEALGVAMPGRVELSRARVNMRMTRPSDGWAVREPASREPCDVVPVEHAVERIERVLVQKLDVIMREHDPRKAARIESALVALAERRRVGDDDDLVLA